MLDRNPRSRGAKRPGCAENVPKGREQEAPGAHCTRGPVCKVESTRVSHHGRTGSPGASCATVLTVSSALSLVTGLCCHHRRRNLFHQLDASVGASGPHGFAVRAQRHSSLTCRVHRIPYPTFRDDRDTPLRVGRDARDMQVIWVRRESEYFCERGWTLIC
jgi:hypothetical protein